MGAVLVHGQTLKHCQWSLKSDVFVVTSIKRTLPCPFGVRIREVRLYHVLAVKLRGIQTHVNRHLLTFSSGIVFITLYLLSNLIIDEVVTTRIRSATFVFMLTYTEHDFVRICMRRTINQGPTVINEQNEFGSLSKII